MEKKAEKKEVADPTEDDNDITNHLKQLEKELRKQNVNKEAVKELQHLTFHERKREVSNLKGKDVYDVSFLK